MLRRTVLSLSERWRPQRVSLRQLLLSQALMLQVMTGECCQSPWSVTRSSWRILRTLLPYLPLILPLPIIVNQSGIVSSGVAVAGDCRGSGVQREACGVQHQHGGGMPPGAPLKKLPGQDAPSKTETFCFTTQSAHGWEAERWMKPLNNRSSWSWKPSFTELSAGKQCCCLKCECLVRNMTK